MKRYCTADIHYNHARIIGYCDRPFKDVKTMQRALIKNWNDTVESEDDIVYIVGDMWMGKNNVQKLEHFLKQLKGRKVLILGNHDDIKPFTYVKHGIESVHTSLILDSASSGVPGTTYLAHDPAVYTCLPDWSFMICGHVHNLFKSQKGCVNAGVDIWDFRPVELKTLYNVYAKELRCSVITQG